MLIDITKAIKVRLTALSISGVVSGGIHHSRAPEGTQMPYAIYAEISDNVTSGTIASRYNRALVQVDVYDDTPDEAGRMAKQLRRMLVN
ncbi:MAG: tail completion protein gp17, partial [Gammaproteobacteria bacterium]